MTAPLKSLEQLDRVGGHPVLDFINTVDSWSADGPGAEYLHDYEDVVRWHELAGLVSSRNAQAFRDATPAARAAGLRDVRRFRDSLHALFHAAAARQAPPERALDHLNDVLRRTVNRRRLVARGTSVSYDWDFTGAPASSIVAPVAWQAAELLEHGEPGRIKACPENDGCGWLFLDSSKNRSRTWCSMKTCGNDAKVKRFRRRRGSPA